jgi:uncharacterized iron-regulated membrane protein
MTYRVAVYDPLTTPQRNLTVEKVSILSQPVSANDATTKTYVDTKDAALKTYVDQWQPAVTAVSGTVTLVTISTTDTAATGMTITPPAGTYNVQFTTVVQNTNNGTNVTASLYTDAVAVSGASATASIKTNNGSVPLTLNAEITVNGSQAINVRWRTSAHTGSMFGRWLTIIKLR